ncbi:hypothetical protein [Kitasatospora sp. CMC57]|uniref:hypothetical protein n=1 Tax=Kitasatospora sp. CMC57 TaxID=3231513 RepID=UPI0038B4A23A
MTVSPLLAVLAAAVVGSGLLLTLSAPRAAPAVGEGLRVALDQGQGQVGSREAVQSSGTAS